jgi:radical SAM protein with 4Fe4S-binding SPASM domain
MAKTENVKDIEINLGKICNNRCIFCMTENADFESHKFATLQEVKAELKEYKKRGFNSIGFLGGEPTLHPNIIEIIAFAKKTNIGKLHLVTNGRRLADKRFVENLFKAGIDRISVSLHSHLPEIEDSFTCVEGSFEQKLAGLQNVFKYRKKMNYKCDLSQNIVLNKMNLKKLPVTINFFSKMGVSDFRINFIQPLGRAENMFQELVPRYSDVKPIFKKIVDIAKKNRLTVSFADMPFCVFSEYKEFYKYMGELKDYIDLVVVLGAKRSSFISRQNEKNTFSWRNKRKNYLKMKTKICLKCKYYDLCEGVWKRYAKSFGLKEIKPIKVVE